MNALTNDVREQTKALLDSAVQSPVRSPATISFSKIWLSALDEADLIALDSVTLAAAIAGTFVLLPKKFDAGCSIETASYIDQRGTSATALLMLNPDMPYLVDSFVMAMRKHRVESRAILNAVLSVERDADGVIVQAATAKTGTDPLESYVLCLLDEELDSADLAALTQSLQSVARDAASVFHDAAALAARMTEVAARAIAASSDEGRETAAFIDWARTVGFEIFGYAFYRAHPAVRELERDHASRIGLLRDPQHRVYDRCLAGIPGEFPSLASRANMLSIVKADTASTLHRDLQLDFIGVREIDVDGALIGEHCFIGLFTRAAAAMPLAQLPFARGRIKQVLMLAGVRREGFRAEKFLEILEALPRTEAFEADPHWLAELCSQVVSLYKQPRTTVFVRRDVYGRHLNVILYLPRVRYSALLVQNLTEVLQTVSGARAVRADTQLADGPLARIYLIASHARLSPVIEETISDALIGAVDGWHRDLDALIDAQSSAPAHARSLLYRLRDALPAAYVAATSPRLAYRDLLQLQCSTAPGQLRVCIDLEPGGQASIRLYSLTIGPALSAILPALHNAGIEIAREQTYVISSDSIDYVITCLIADAISARKLAQPRVADTARVLFAALLNDQAEDGRMNGLAIEAALQLREVQLIRAYASFWRQAGCRFSLRYIADCLRQQPTHVRALVDHFLQRFDPQLEAAQRDAGTAALVALRNNLTEINHVDSETILRSLADLMLATVRTSYFQPSQQTDTMLFKFDAATLTFLPQPRPYRELFVFARRFEGVHLRGGPVARGGLRWSDRMEDYRTEVLGLVKAQMVKNAVIVPLGAKGGFVCKMVPKNASRDIVNAEGEAVYRCFIAGLLDLTDNRVGGVVVAPLHTVCYDAPDPYLVVAADKGTATFSDIANSIAVARGFWLGDAFASGGSNGYDHKKLGITAKGAWEAVKRHFYEIGHDLASTPITVVGIGDMSGDVFGNGMLLSRQVKLIAAFDHRHIFIDPTPDVASSFAERQRLFDLPRSSWEDYDKSLISAGGGVWPRSARQIDLSDAVRTALGLIETQLTPDELLHHILCAPVDLFYNGGIGTYIKASTESHADVRDRANDAIRVDGNAMRCKVVAEGGNLGATQNGRIEYALCGGRIFTDAIDNSAGVDCSDHEVNVKIWLDTEVNAGTLTVAERNRSLTEITTDIEMLVLRDNTLQTHLLTRETEAQSDPIVTDKYAALILALEHEGALSRSLDQLPASAELAHRRTVGLGLGLTAPELAVVIAHAKNRSKAMLAQQALVEQRWAAPLLTSYFPAALVARRDPLAHPLANPILATVLANDMINRCGPLMSGQLAQQHHVSEVEVAMAWAQAWVVLQLQKPFAVLDRYAMRVPPAVARDIDRRCREVQVAMTAGLLSIPSAHRTDAGMDELMRLFDGSEASPLSAPPMAITDALSVALAALPAELSNAVAELDTLQRVADFLFAALLVERPVSMRYATVLHAGLALRQQSGIDCIEQALMHLVLAPEQQTLRSHALNSLRATQQMLLRTLLTHAQIEQDIDAAVVACVERLPPLSSLSDATPTFDQMVLAVWTLADAAASTAAR